MNAMSPDSGYTAAVLRTSAQIRQSRTSYVRKTLSETSESVITLCEVNKNEELWGSKKEKEKEIEEMRKFGESAGIEDLMAVYGEYQRLMLIATQYLKETGPRFTFSITDSTS